MTKTKSTSRFHDASSAKPKRRRLLKARKKDTDSSTMRTPDPPPVNSRTQADYPTTADSYHSPQSQKTAVPKGPISTPDNPPGRWAFYGPKPEADAKQVLSMDKSVLFPILTSKGDISIISTIFPFLTSLYQTQIQSETRRPTTTSSTKT